MVILSWPFLTTEAGTCVLLFRWSHDGKFFARMTLDTLSIYETPVSGTISREAGCLLGA